MYVIHDTDKRERENIFTFTLVANITQAIMWCISGVYS